VADINDDDERRVVIGNGADVALGLSRALIIASSQASVPRTGWKIFCG